MCVSQEGVHMRTYHVLISKEINRVEFPRVGVTVHSKLSNVGAGNQVGPLQVQGLIITLKTKWEFWNSAGCMCVKEGGQFWRVFIPDTERNCVFSASAQCYVSFFLEAHGSGLLKSQLGKLNFFPPEIDVRLCQTLIFASITVNIPEFIKFNLVNDGLYWLISEMKGSLW